MESIANILDNNDCQKILQESLKDNHSKLLDFKMENLGGGIMGWLAEHLKLRLYYEKQGIKLEKTYFLKTMPTNNQDQLDYIKKMGVFSKEIKVYLNLLNTFRNYVDQPFAPICYYQKDYQTFVLEDLSIFNYCVSKNQYLSEEECYSVLKSISGLHGASLVFEEKHAVRINEHFVEETQEATFSFIEGHPRFKWMRAVTTCLKDLCKFYSNDQSLPDKIDKYIYQELPKFLIPSKEFRNVLIHDDLWKNNIMFDDNKNAMLIDFQLTKYVPPMFDVLVFIFMNMPRGFIEKNLQNLLDFYHDNLQKVLAKNNIKINDIFLKEDMMKQAKLYYLPSLVEAAMYGTNVFITQDLTDEIMKDESKFQEFVFLNRSSFILRHFEESDIFKARIHNVLDPLYKHFI